MSRKSGKDEVRARRRRTCPTTRSRPVRWSPAPTSSSSGLSLRNPPALPSAKRVPSRFLTTSTSHLRRRRPADIEAWYINRFLKLRGTAFVEDQSYFRSYANLDDEDAVERARAIWRKINLPNLVDNIEPTRDRATLVIRKGSDHRVTSLKLRKI